MENKKIELLVRAIIETNGKILVCQKKGKDYYFLPGGHVEFGESSKQALARELKEELGLKIKECSFIGGTEHLFIEDGEKRHEINLAFQTAVEEIKTKSKEGHLQFFLFDKERLEKETILPDVLKNAILVWLKNKKLFWQSQWED